MRQLSRGQLGLASPWPRFSLTLLLLLPLLASAYRVRGANTVADDGSHEVPGHSHHGPSHSHGSVLQKMKAMQRLKAVEWDMRMAPLEPLLEAYAERHRACTSAEKLPGKYLVVRFEDKDAGIGNQLPSIVSGFLLALIMDRCMFVDFPFFNKYFSHDLDFSWKRHYKRMLEHGHNANNTQNIPARIPFGYVTIADMWMFQNITRYFDSHYGVEMWKDLDYSVALLVNNPNHKDFIEAYFRTREIFAPLASYVLRIKPKYAKKIKEFKQKNFRLFNIGMQIRRRKCNGDKNELLCELRPTIESYCVVAKHIQLLHGLHDNDVRFFLAADEADTYDQVIQILGAERVVFTDNGIAPGSSKKGVINLADNPGTLESALMDMALMSHCNDLVMTVASSFGYVAAAWGGYAPVHMVYGKHTTSQNPYWYRAISSEPCYWQAKNMMRALDARAVNRFKSNPLWMQYTQCHNDWDTESEDTDDSS